MRALSWRDIPVLVDLERDLFGHEAWTAQTWWAELAQGTRRAYVVAGPAPGEAGARPGGEVWGYAGLDLAGELADVMTIATAPHAQGRGIGSLLMDHLIAMARGAGAVQLHLEVRADNEAARRLYDRYGFSVLRIRRRYYQPDDVDAVIMGLDLSSAPSLEEER